jgi:hypothetical protein
MIGFWPSHTLWIGRINYLIAHKTSCPAADARPYVLFIVFYRKSYIDFAVCTSIRAALYIEAASMSLPVVIKVCPPAASDVVDRGGLKWAREPEHFLLKANILGVSTWSGDFKRRRLP